MQKIVIDEEFKALLPALDKETYDMLEANLIQNGCRDSIVLWGDILIDGHNRYEICTKHGIEYGTVAKEFGSREEALIWIISTQVSRRNLSPIQLSHFRGLHYMADKRLQGGDRKSKSQNGTLIEDSTGSTARRLASNYRVSRNTIMRDAKAAAAIEAIGEVSPPAKKMILAGEVNIDKVKLRNLSESPKEEIREVAAAIENGTYEKNGSTPASSSPAKPVDAIIAGMRPLSPVIDNLADTFSALPKIRSKADREKLKTALRPHIDRLEELFKQI